MRLSRIYEETALFTLVITLFVASGVAPAALLFADASNTTQTVQKLKTEANGYIDMRLDSLAKIQDKLAENTELKPAVLNSLQSELNGDATQLTTIRKQVDASSDPNRIINLTDQIFTKLRIYKLVIPSKNLIISGDKLRHEANMLAGRQQQLSAQVVALQASQPSKASQLKQQLSSMLIDINSGRAAANEAVKEALALTAKDFNNNTSIISERYQAQHQIQAQLQQAYDIGNQVSQALKSSGNVKSPNIVFILTDDMDMSLAQYMPNTQKLIGEQGATFTNYYDNISLCCAARSTILRGQYAHNTSIYGNYAPYGGWYAFYKKGLQNSTIATWLQSAHYDTGMMGKYLNGFPNGDGNLTLPDNYIPPGWNYWVGAAGGNPYSEYNYVLNVNGKVGSDQHRMKKNGKLQPQNYFVDVISNYANQFISQAHPNGYFAYVATYAPHSPYTPPPRYQNDFTNVTYPNKPNRTGLSAADIARFNNYYRDRIRAVKAVDDMVKRLYDTVASRGQLNNTYFVFTSDNGYHMGEHGLGAGKDTMYNEDLHMPLYIAGPGIKAGTVVNETVGNVDLASTFADMGNTSTPAFVDGRSLLPLAKGAHPKNWPEFILTERPDYDNNQRMQSQDTSNLSATGKDTLMEPADSPAEVGPRHVVPYQGIRNGNYLYVVYGNGNKVLFNEQNDPYELHNLMTPSGNLTSAGSGTNLQKLVRFLNQLKDCAGVSCSE